MDTKGLTFSLSYISRFFPSPTTAIEMFCEEKRVKVDHMTVT